MQPHCRQRARILLASLCLMLVTLSPMAGTTRGLDLSAISDRLRDAEKGAQSEPVKQILRTARRALDHADEQNERGDSAGADAELRAASAALEKAAPLVGSESENLRAAVQSIRDSLATALAPAIAVTRQDVETAAGLHVATFDTLQGTVTVNLPDDMAAGDTISGTVIAEGKGSTPEEKQRNQDSLSGTVVEMEQQKTAASDPGGRGKWVVPAAAVVAIPLILRDHQGRTIGKVDIPVAKAPTGQVVPAGRNDRPAGAAPSAASVGAFQLPSAGQSGKPVTITGPFDGDSSTSVVSVAGKAIDVLAESPRKLVARAPSGIVGVAVLEVTKRLQVTHCEYRNLGVKLSAANLNLKGGERTTMTVTVDGAEGMAQSVPLSVVNRSPTVVHLDSGDTQTLEIDPRKLTAGKFVATRGLTGVKPGGFNITASIAPGSIPPAACTTTSAAPPSPPARPATTVPGSAQAAPRQGPVIDTPGSNWDFEQGLAGWKPTGDAFTHQPTLGDNVVAARVRTDMTLERGGIGGDYWRRVPYPIGHHLDAWVGTSENHPNPATPLGAVGGDAGTGTLTSGVFPLDDGHRFIAFVVGGGSDVATERVELQVRGENDADIADLEGLVAANRYATVGLAALMGGTALANGVGERDGNYVVALTASGHDSEVMRPVVFEVPRTLRGRQGRIRIVDNAGGTWGHINADDFRFGAAQPPDRSPRLWGFADTHAHPMNDLAFGGNLIQGSLYARDGSAYASEGYRKTALPTMFDSIGRPQLGQLGTLLTAIGHGPILDSTRLIRSGYPELQGYPTTSQMAGQTVYSEWVRRAYDGGLRLMSALAVNTWVVSSLPLKRAVLGSTQPESDKGSADVQVADIKAWAALPENRSWVEVAFTPADARRIIGSNKLAIVIGIELDSLGNFVPNGWFRPTLPPGEPGPVVMPADRTEQRRLIAAEVDRLYAEGVRQIGPFHYVSGVWGGAAVSQRFFNDINRGITGDNVEVVSGDAEGIRYRLDMDGWGAGGLASRTALTGAGNHQGSTWEGTRLGHMNAMPLLPAGTILFEEMTRRGLLIDVDHASHRSVEGLLALATPRHYPLLSSHSDYLDLGLPDLGPTGHLGLTGPGDFTYLGLIYDDAANLRRFDTTIQDPLRNERMITRASLRAIHELGGTTGVIMWLPRRTSWGDAVPNDCDGSSKTWAQSYQYAVDVTGGRGVALSTDRVTIYPRFGPNSGFLLGLEGSSMYHRDERRFQQVDAQSNGVRYDTPLREWGAFRFKLALGTSGAWEKTPVRDSSSSEPSTTWESQPVEIGDAWMAIAAWAAGRNPRTMPLPRHGIDGGPRVIDYAWGLGSTSESEVYSDGVLQLPGALHSRYAAYCVMNRRVPSDLRSLRFDLSVDRIWDEYWWVKRAYEQWQRMEGNNEPLRRYIFGYRDLGAERVSRDFDVNLDGVAHYGMIPDFLQDVANSHRRPAEVGAYLNPLFSSAESFISMWEKARTAAGLHDSDP